MATAQLLKKSLILGFSFALAAALGCHAGQGAGETRAGAAPATPAAGATAAQPTKAQGDWRRSVTEAVSRATILRVEGAAQATPGEKLAGYLTRPVTERPLSADSLKAFIEIMRADAGFNEGILRRCRPGVSVGMRLFSKDAAAAEVHNEVVIDFGCNRLVAIDAGSAQAREAYFDALRPRFVTFAQQALPDDAELRALH